MNENLLTRTASLAMEITRTYLQEGDTAVDATCGNGHDTLALAETVGKGGRILAVDLQESAIHASRQLLMTHGIDNTAFVCGSFVHLSDYWHTFSETILAETEAAPKVIVFNLGYLPGGDKQVTTRTQDTLLAVEQALSIVARGGIVTLVLYPGHEEGAREKAALLQFAEQLPASRFHTAHVGSP